MVCRCIVETIKLLNRNVLFNLHLWVSFHWIHSVLVELGHQKKPQQNSDTQTHRLTRYLLVQDIVCSVALQSLATQTERFVNISCTIRLITIAAVSWIYRNAYPFRSDFSFRWWPAVHFDLRQVMASRVVHNQRFRFPFDYYYCYHYHLLHNIIRGQYKCKLIDSLSPNVPLPLPSHILCTNGMMTVYTRTQSTDQWRRDVIIHYYLSKNVQSMNCLSTGAIVKSHCRVILAFCFSHHRHRTYAHSSYPVYSNPSRGFISYRASALPKYEQLKSTEVCNQYSHEFRIHTIRLWLGWLMVVYEWQRK